MGDTIHKVSVRFDVTKKEDAETLRRLQESADENRRALSHEVIYVLRKHYKVTK